MHCNVTVKGRPGEFLAWAVRPPPSSIGVLFCPLFVFPPLTFSLFPTPVYDLVGPKETPGTAYFLVEMIIL